MTFRRALLSPVRIVVRPAWRRLWALLERRLQPVDARIAALESRTALALRAAEEQAQQVRSLTESSARAEHDIAGARATGTAAQEAAQRAETTLARFPALEDAWRQHVPAFLNAVGTVRAFGFDLSAQRAALAAAVARQGAEAATLRGEIAGGREELGRSVEALRDAAATTAAEGLRTLEELRATVQQNLRQAIDTIRIETRAERAGIRAELHEALEAERAAAEGRMRAFAAETRDGAVHAVQDRLEFVRREMLYEMLHGGGSVPAKAAVEPRVVAPEKLAAAGDALRINVGCGHIPLDGYINVDQRDLPGVDIIAEAGAIPLSPGTVQEVFSAHLLEHFPQEALRRRLLPYWRDIMKPGATFCAVVPDGEAMLGGIAAGTYPFEEFREVLFGAQDYTGDFHYNLYTPASLAALLEEAGFREVDTPVRGRRNGKCFEFEIRAVRA